MSHQKNKGKDNSNSQLQLGMGTPWHKHAGMWEFKVSRIITKNLLFVLFVGKPHPQDGSSLIYGSPGLLHEQRESMLEQLTGSGRDRSGVTFVPNLDQADNSSARYLNTEDNYRITFT